MDQLSKKLSMLSAKDCAKQEGGIVAMRGHGATVRSRTHLSHLAEANQVSDQDFVGFDLLR